jgi:redox-sensitive bicupin YhaK (pirin superfamily)
MKTTLYRASSRGHAYHGWLDTHHTFSFADYHDRNRVRFGVLRVLNDDIVKGGEGFGTHPHENMEIISIPLYGDLEHKDSMGNTGVIRAGEVQVMSAGTGITHSEYNSNESAPLNFFQIWVFPNRKNVTPRYDQKKFANFHTKNELVQVVGSKDDATNTGLWIYQDAWFSIGLFDQGFELEYKIKKPDNGLFAMVIEGEFTIEGEQLYRRDGFSLSDIDSIKITADSENARILLMDVPMSLG